MDKLDKDAFNSLEALVSNISNEEILLIQDLILTFINWYDKLVGILVSDNYSQEMKNFLTTLFSGLKNIDIKKCTQTGSSTFNVSIIVRAIDVLLKSRIKSPSDFTSCYSILTDLASGGVIESYAVEHLSTKDSKLIIRINTDKNTPAFIIFELDKNKKIISSIQRDRPVLFRNLRLVDKEG